MGLSAYPLIAHAADSPPAISTVPAGAYNWTQPLFTPEGYLSMRLAGSQARPVGADRIDLTEVNVTVFSGTPAPSVETILLSPAASYFPKYKRVSGSGGVRVIRFQNNRELYEITGEDWTYEDAGKRVSIHKNVHVVYSATLNGLAP